MKKKSLFLFPAIGTLLTGCSLKDLNNNVIRWTNEHLFGSAENNKNSSEQEEDSQTPADTKYDDGYVDGYLKGYDEGKTSGYEEGFSDGKTEGLEEGYNQGKEDGKEEDKDNKSIHTTLQLQYLNNNDYSILPSAVTGNAENSKPLPLEFDVKESPLFDANDVTSSKLRISETNDFANYVEVDGDTNNHFEVYNLKINTKYYYYYWAVTSTGTFYSDIKEVFVKNEAPRLLNIDGVTNARDDGGWKIKGQDKYTKQGLMFRMGKLNSASSTSITAEGIASFKALGIRTEIDLRKSSDNPPTTSAVDGVDYYNYPLSHDTNLGYFTDATNREGVKNVLELMSDSSKYPLMFHCNIGTDRTGFVSFIVNALLGVEEEYLYRDYMMSNYANIGGTRDIASISTYISKLKSDYDGSSNLSLGAKNYMLELGVSETNINNIKNILLEA